MADSAERYKQLARALQLLDILSHARFGKTIRELRDEVVDSLGLTDLHAKSIERDLKNLQAAGFNLESHRTDDPKRPVVWKMATGRRAIPDVPISVMELLSFSAAMELLDPLVGTPFWQGLQMLWTKMRRGVPESVWEHFDRQRAGLFVRGSRSRDYAEKEGMLSALNRAIYQHRRIDAEYRPTPTAEAAVRRLEPHGVVLFAGALYVAATSPDDPERTIKTFKVDRVLRVTVLDERFEPRPDFDPARFFDDSIGIYRGKETEAFVVKIDRHCAAWVADAPFHPRQEVEALANGDLIVRIDRGYREEILTRVLSLGRYAEILEPVDCRDRMREIIDAMRLRYAD